MRRILQLLLVVFAVTSCQKINGFDNLHITPNTSLPIGKSLISDSSLFALANLDKMLYVNNHDVLTFIMRDTTNIVNKKKIDNIFKLPKQVFNLNVALPTPAPGETEVTIPNGTKKTETINPGAGENIEEMVFNSGYIKFKISTAGNFDKLLITIPEITKNGNPITLRNNETILLDNSYLIAPASGNKLDVVFSGTVPAVPSMEGELELFSDNVNRVKGDLGRKTIAPIHTDIKVEGAAFGQFTSKANYVYFTDPYVFVTIKNVYDIPLLVNIDRIDINQESIGLKNELNTSRFLVEPLGSIIVTLSNENTVSGKGFSENITKDFKIVTVTVSGILNPTKADIGISEYQPKLPNNLFLDKELNVFYDLNIPFDMVLDNVVFEQSTDINLSSMAENVTYEELSMAFSGLNQMPMDLNIRPFVTNDNTKTGEKTFLFSTPLVIKGTESKLKPKHANFVPSSFVEANRIIRKIDQQAISKVLKSKKLFIELAGSTVNAQQKTAVKLYSPSKIELNVMIGAKADIVINPSK